MTGVVFCYRFSKEKLLEHALKVIERVIERRIREKVKIDAMQFEYMPGKGTTNAIFTVRQMQEKYGCKRKKFYFAFVDLEKAFDRVPREVTRWALVRVRSKKARVEEWLMNAVMAMYEGAQTVVKTTEGDSNAFNVKVGLHQGSVLSSIILILLTFWSLTDRDRRMCKNNWLCFDEFLM